MKKNPASIEDSANAEAQKKADASANAAGNIFHSKPAENQATKEKQTMKTTKPRAVRQYEAIESHGKNLLAIFPNATEKDPVALCKKLRRLETAAHAIGLRLCNGPEYPHGDVDADFACEIIIDKVSALLGNPPAHIAAHVPVFINRDPRGYALKIQDVWMNQRREQWDRQIAKQGKKAITEGYWALLRFHRDWGGYGIIAPEITGD